MRSMLPLGAAAGTVLVMLLGLGVNAALGPPTERSVDAQHLVARWNEATDEPRLQLRGPTARCDPEVVASGSLVDLVPQCRDGSLVRFTVTLDAQAGNRADIAEAAFGAEFKTVAHPDGSHTFHVRPPAPIRVQDPGAIERFSRRPLLMHSAALLALAAIHAFAHWSGSRFWDLLAIPAVAAWSLVVLADMEFLDARQSIVSVTVVVSASVIANLLALAMIDDPVSIDLRDDSALRPRIHEHEYDWPQTPAAHDIDLTERNQQDSRWRRNPGPTSSRDQPI